jgi:hypothetical protein
MGFGNCPGCRRWIDRAIFRFRFRFRFHVHVQVKFQCPYLLWMEAVVIFVWNVVDDVVVVVVIVIVIVIVLYSYGCYVLEIVLIP